MSVFSTTLAQWYAQHARQLPWRNISDPYKIWLSEIIMQQTRIEQGTAYYLKFIDRFPTIFHLARASEVEVLNLWQGLGYYTRARNLLHTAKEIVVKYGGKFPATYTEILKLKGVGTYTAAAIASFAFQEPTALVDGNVYRFLSRYFDIPTPIDSTQGKKELQQLADRLMNKHNPSMHNQAMMEFGALQCVPIRPNCHACVMNNTCLAFAHDSVSDRPVKVKKTRVVDRYFYYAVLREDNKVCVRQRLSADIWQYLYEFPLYEANIRYSEQELHQYFQQLYGLSIDFISTEIKHLLSHQRIIARFVHFSTIPTTLHMQSVCYEQLSSLPLPRLIDRYWNALF